MAKIIKLNLHEGQKLINPTKTTRKSSTNPFDKNPFKYEDFEGNTLPVTAFADVFVGKTNKLKMISASVMGTVTKLHNCITEPIVNFVKRIGSGISTAWNYAKNTNIELSGLKTIGEGIHDVLNYDVGKGISNSISNIGKGLSNSIEYLNKDVTEIGKGLSDKWIGLISNLHITGKKITSDLPVAELKSLWLDQIAIEKNAAKEISMNTNKMKEQVA
jgi:hypothetical protein